MNQIAADTRCFHCEQPIDGEPVLQSFDGVSRQFCGADCRDAAAQIYGLSLDDFYAYRDRFTAERGGDANDSRDSVAQSSGASCCSGKTDGAGLTAGKNATPSARELEFATVDRPLGDGTREVSLHVPDIRCAACTWLIESSLAKRSDLVRCRTVLADRSVTIDYRGSSPLDVIASIEALGFTVLPDRGARIKQVQAIDRQSMLARLGLAGIGMMQVMMYAIASYVAGEGGIEPAYLSLMHWASLAVTTPIVFYSAMPFHRGALRDLRNGSPGMDVPVSLAIAAAWTLSLVNTLRGAGDVYFDSVAMFTFLLLIGRFVELGSRQRFETSRLLNEGLLPASAVNADTGERLDIRGVREGMRLRVAVGEVITADGLILSGHTSIDEAAFTGESVPVEKRAGQRVNAGAVNLEGEIVIEAQAGFDDFVISRISSLYRQAASFRPRFATIADQAARYFVVGILSLAALSGLYWYLAGGDWFTVALTVLVVSCPCALSLATPVAYTVALATLRNAGVVVNTGRFLERLSTVTRVVFDKTGTLTRGALQIDEVRIVGEVSEDEARRIASALERESRHPIALAFDDPSDLTVSLRDDAPGAGVSGEVDGQRISLGRADFACPGIQPPDADGLWILLASDRPLAWFRLRDTIRPETADVIDQLRGDVSMSLLTGDVSSEGARLANELGITDVMTGMSPEQKIDAVKARQTAGDIVLMVGDGVNDAGAMAIADVSLAVSPADLMVQEAADATLLDSDLGSVPAVIRYAGRVSNIVRQNVFWAIFYNVSVIPLAVSGLITPWMAAAGMSASSVLVVLNANRLRKEVTWKLSSS